MCGKYKTVRDQAQAEILKHVEQTWDVGHGTWEDVILIEDERREDSKTQKQDPGRRSPFESYSLPVSESLGSRTLLSASGIASMRTRVSASLSVDDRVIRYTRGSPIRPAVQYGGIYETAGVAFV